jgi:3,2-trans-enoyl-CoA isomerase
MSLVRVMLDAAPRASVLFLNRPPVNALNKALLTDLGNAIKFIEKERASPDRGWGLVIAAENSSTASTFSAGLDLSEMYQKSATQLGEFWSSLQEMWLSLYGSRLATVAAVNGQSPAGGCLITMSCDYRIGASDQPKARIGLNEAKFGLVAPTWFGTTLQAAVGLRRADRMLQLGELISFEDAHKYGLLDELVPRADVLKVALDRAEQWAKNGPAEARHASKMIQRRAALEELRGSRRADVQIFVDRVSAVSMQEDIGNYLASLKKAK